MGYTLLLIWFFIFCVTYEIIEQINKMVNLCEREDERCLF